MEKSILIQNATHHNLKNVTVSIPRNKLTLITGVSGSGKSTLAFDTLYAEGQRRFVESLSSYARQFLERMTKPEVDAIIGLLPAVAIEQKTPPRNPRSTVGTVTEIYDYIRALYARIGKTICAKCGKEVTAHSPASIAEQIVNSANAKIKKTTKNTKKDPNPWHLDDKLYIMIELLPSNKTVDTISNLSTFAKELDRLTKFGFTRIVQTGSDEVIDIDELKITHHSTLTDYCVLVDRWIVSTEKDDISRLVDSLEVAFTANAHHIVIRNISTNFEEHFSNIFECADCHVKYEEPSPRTFAFNTPQGACPECHGAGQAYGIDENLVIPDFALSLEGHCILPYKTPATASVFQTMIAVCNKHKIPINVPYKDLTPAQKDVIWNGKDKYFGINEYFRYVESQNHKIQNRLIVSKYRGMSVCRSCEGSRLKFAARQVFVNGKNIPELINMPLEDLYQFILNLELTKYEKQATELIVSEMLARTKMLVDIGLEYITLGRSCHTLSGGEYQRINLSTALGSTLVDTLYVLDEPSIGMHARDTQRLLNILFRLRNLGNTIVVVEHDLDIIRKADYIIDMGLGAGSNGGNVIAEGKFDEFIENPNSLTAKYFKHEKTIEIPKSRRPVSLNKISIFGASENNLRIERCDIPTKNFVVITGVSGSGKSTLVYDVLYSGILEKFGQIPKDYKLGKFSSISGINFVSEVDIVSQSPIGKSSRSTPATYLKVFDYIREIYAQTQIAQQMGIKPGYFSFNVPGGRCEDCEGEGSNTVDMQFLPDIKIVCESCGGTRYKKEVKNILYRGKNIIEVLDMTVAEALYHFLGVAKIENKLKILQSVGLDYIKLGQSSSTLSGGESQRIKLAAHIDSIERKGCLYILDEPTTGLHLDDISKLVAAINKLVDAGNSVVIIEHNLHVMSVADWIIDLGPEAGNRGGMIVGQGTPEDIAKLDTHTGIALRQFLAENPCKQ